MSFVLEADVIKTSPLRGAARTIHIVLANHADKDSICWPKQETLAKEAGCSVRYVQKVLPQMVELGLIEIVQRAGPGNYHQYKILTSKANSSSGSKANSSSGSKANYSSPSYKEEPPEEPSEENYAPAARDQTNQGEDDSMPWIPTQATNEEWERTGVSDEAGEEQVREKPKKPRYKEIPPNSAEMCRWRFRRGAVKIGRPHYNEATVNRGIKELRTGTGKADRAYSYSEIEKMIDIMFVKHAAHFNGKTDDIGVLFLFLITKLQQEAAQSFTYKSDETYEQTRATAQGYWEQYTKSERTANA